MESRVQCPQQLATAAEVAETRGGGAVSERLCGTNRTVSGRSGRQQRTSGWPLTTVTSAASTRAATKPPHPGPSGPLLLPVAWP